MFKQTVAHLYTGILLGNKKTQSIDRCNNLDGPQGHYASEKASFKRPNTI